MKKITPIAVLLLPSVAGAYFYAGNDLVPAMREWEKASAGDYSADVGKVGIYLGYITAANDILEDEGIVCSSSRKTTVNQLAAVAAEYIKNNPEKWDGPAYMLVAAPLASAFPCQPAPAAKQP